MSNKTIHELDSLSEIAQNDEMLIYDNSAGADNPTKKTTVGTIKDFMANNIKDVYSTDEVKTNKVWIDGKPIYRKVFYSATNWENNAVIGSIPNFDTIVIIMNVSRFASSDVSNYQNYGNDGQNWSMAYVSTVNNDVIVQRGGGFLNNLPSSVIVEYTKTTA